MRGHNLSPTPDVNRGICALAMRYDMVGISILEPRIWIWTVKNVFSFFIFGTVPQYAWYRIGTVQSTQECNLFPKMGPFWYRSKKFCTELGPFCCKILNPVQNLDRFGIFRIAGR